MLQQFVNAKLCILIFSGPAVTNLSHPTNRVISNKIKKSFKSVEENRENIAILEDIGLMTLWLDFQIDLIQIQLQSISQFTPTFIGYISLVEMSLRCVYVSQASLRVQSSKTNLVRVAKNCSKLA